MSCCGKSEVSSRDLLDSVQRGVHYNELGQDWELADKIRYSGEILEDRNVFLKKTYKFPDYNKALEFVIMVSELAETIQHHPDIELKWGEVTITLWTHHAGGLTVYDFDLAKAIEQKVKQQ